MWTRALLPAAVLLALALAVVSADAQRIAPDRSPHLFTVPTEGRPAAALARTDARVVARYDSFTLVEAAGEDAERLRRAGADRRDDMREVTLVDRELDPRRERRSLAGKGRRPAGEGLALVQFVGPVKGAWLTRLRRTGVRVVTYMAENGYLVHGSARELGRAAGLRGADPAVRAVVPYVTGDKLGPGVKPAGRQKLAVQTLSGADGAVVRARVARAGRTTRATSTAGGLHTQYIHADAGQVVSLAGDPGVVSVLTAPDPELYDEIADQIVAGNLTGADPLVPSGPGYFAFHEGLGLGSGTFPFSVDVTDEGIGNGSTAAPPADFQVNGSGASRIDYVDDYTSDTDHPTHGTAARDCGGHGSINAGIIGGFNTGTGSSGSGAVEDAQGFNYNLGSAPRTKLGGSKIFTCAGPFSMPGSTFTTLTTTAYNKGARISSNSWGADVGGLYNADSREYDFLVRDAVPGTAGNQQFVEVMAAGNAGPGGATVGSPGTGKNVITVGASESVRASGTDGCAVTNAGADDARDIIDFSSRGPAAGGRVKPDLVAPGTHITGAKSWSAGYNGNGVCNPSFPAGSTLYNLSSGTSHSTPVVSGMAAVAREWYRLKVPGGNPPSPAMTKALLSGSATNLAGGADGAGGTNANVPNNVQGWGLANMARALDTGPRYFRDQQNVLGASGDSFARTFDVQDPTKPVRITLAYTDAPGPVGSAPEVNNLDLSVDAGSSAYKGNVFSGGQSTPGGSADADNNVESVYLPAGTGDPISVQVQATNIAGDGVPGNADTTDQDFALVVSNAAEVNSPVLVHRSRSVSEQGDGDGNIEPGEDAGISQEIENAGSAAATEISGTLSGPSSVTFPDGTAAWPHLAVGAEAVNSDPLTASVEPGTSCGAPLELSLEITSAQGSTNLVPITLSTGGTGSPVARDSSDVPKAIPDNNSTGVSSGLTVSQPGFVKDVNVRIGSLSHTWVGDLKIDLIGPDNTVVNLANRPGGENNSGNNFTNTVFDDEASAPIGPPATPPYTGSFRPQADQLSRFDGKPQQGSWKLRVSDHVQEDAGTLKSWGHDIRPAACDAPPAQATGLTATGGNQSVALDWGDVSGATGYQLFRKNSDGTYPSTPTATPASSQHTDTGRSPGTRYCYKVRAVKNGIKGPFSSEACATTDPPGSPPGAVSNFTASPGVESVVLDWNDTANATGYQVFRKSSDGTYPATPTASPTSSSFTDTGRTAGTQYCYKVRAVNGGGEGPLSGEQCATPQGNPPAGIAGLTATAGVESVALDWDDTAGASDYLVFRRNPDGTYPVLPIATVGSSQHTDTGRPAGVQQCYKVQASNTWGNGPLSGEACATPAAVPPPPAPDGGGPGDGPGDGGTPGDGGAGDVGTPGGETPGAGRSSMPILPVLPILDLSSLPRNVTVGSTGVFIVRFRGTPGLSGSFTATTVRAIAAAARRRKLVLARRSFTVPASGRVRLRLKLSRKHLRALRRARRLAVSTKVTIGTQSASRRITFKAARRR
jgi:subtilisin-like proprotein convertase family protein